MIWNWDSAFEGSPSGSDYGSVSGRILRRTKEAFLALLETEHTVDLGADAVVSHTQGMASILGPATHSAITIEIGGLVLDGGALYSYDGTDDLGFGDHSLLVNASPSDHPQYLARIGTEFKGVVNCTRVSHLTEILQEYTDTHFLLSNAGHPEDSTPNHGSVSAANLGLGSDHLTIATSFVTRNYDLSVVGSGTVTEMTNNGPRDYDVISADVPTAGSYTIGISIVQVEAISVEDEYSLGYDLVAPEGSGGTSYQTNLQVAAIARDSPLSSHNNEKMTLSAVGLS